LTTSSSRIPGRAVAASLVGVAALVGCSTLIGFPDVAPLGDGLADGAVPDASVDSHASHRKDAGHDSGKPKHDAGHDARHDATEHKDAGEHHDAARHDAKEDAPARGDAGHDSGEPACAPDCPAATPCATGAICGSRTCTGGICVDPACSPNCATGKACGASTDCASGYCSKGLCENAASCLDIYASNTNPGVYEIDPDGTGGLPPFKVYCTDGWTTLPLNFEDPSFWSITKSQSSATGTPDDAGACITVSVSDAGGGYWQYQSVTTTGWTTTLMKFLPPVPAKSVQFVQFVYTNGGTTDTMDFEVGALPTSDLDDGWFFATVSHGKPTPVGYTFPKSTYCLSPYEYLDAGKLCTRDQAPTGSLIVLNETVSLSPSAPSFIMGLMQGCASPGIGVTGQQFKIATPPADGGVWTTGIQVQ
jgi:hypothetical protein